MPEVALEQVFLADRPRLFQLAYRMMGTVCDAEDALQDVFVRIKSSELPEVHAAPFVSDARGRAALSRPVEVGATQTRTLCRPVAS